MTLLQPFQSASHRSSLQMILSPRPNRALKTSTSGIPICLLGRRQNRPRRNTDSRQLLLRQPLKMSKALTTGGTMGLH